jgi:hypothetical protein
MFLKSCFWVENRIYKSKKAHLHISYKDMMGKSRNFGDDFIYNLFPLYVEILLVCEGRKEGEKLVIKESFTKNEKMSAKCVESAEVEEKFDSFKSYQKLLTKILIYPKKVFNFSFQTFFKSLSTTHLFRRLKTIS